MLGNLPSKYPAGTGIAYFFYLILLSIGMITYGGILMHTGNKIEDLSTQQTDYIKQMSRDWDRPYYTDILVTNSYSCPAGTDEVYERIWPGN